MCNPLTLIKLENPKTWILVETVNYISSLTYFFSEFYFIGPESIAIITAIDK